MTTDQPGTLGAPRLRARRLPEPTRLELAQRGVAIARSMTTHFAPLALRQLRELRGGPLPAAAVARPLRLVFEDLGGTFIKFGQIVASSPGMFGDQVADEFRSCLDTGPPVDVADVRQRVEDDLGVSLSDAFAEFETEPVGRASIAVVHRARLHDGRAVAVKVLRPGIEHVVATDLDLIQPLIEVVVRETGDQVAGSLLQLLDGFRVQIGEELDLRNEARSLARFRSLGAELPLPLLVVPEPHPDLSGPNVLTMEFLDGVPIDDLAQVAELGLDPAPLVEQVVRAFFVTTVRWGAFHGDVHAGNMLLLHDGRIGVIDWGIVGRLDPETHRFFLRLLAAALGEESAWADVSAHISATYGPAIKEALGVDDRGLAAFVRSLVEPTLNRPFGEVSLATFFQQTQLQVATAQGIEAHSRSLRSVAHRLRTQRRLRRMVDQSGGVMSEFDRGTFLLGKQLMYFERYGRMFLADVPLLNDRDFFAALLAGAPDPAGPGPPLTGPGDRGAGGGTAPAPLPSKTEMCSTSGRSEPEARSGRRVDPGSATSGTTGTGASAGEGEMAANEAEVLTSTHVLEYPYSRSVGPVIGGFLTGLREGRILGAPGRGGAVIVPPTEYDPDTAEATGPLVEVGPEGTLESWAWVGRPAPKHPLDHPFAWALVRLDGAATAMLHVLDAGSPDRVTTGMRVVAEFLPAEDRVGRVQDIRAFVPAGGAA